MTIAIFAAPLAMPREAWPAEMPPEVDLAVSRGLDSLSRQQNPDGSFEGGGPRLAVTGLSLMAFLAAGDVADVGRYGLNVRNAIDFLLSQQQPDGYFGRVDASRMYGQAIVTLALAEAYGVETNEDERQRIYAVLAKAVGVILAAQDVKKADVYAGGWRYEPQAPDSDISLSGWNALALRAGEDAGLAVPKSAVKRAADFVLKCYRPDLRGFAYQPGGGPLTSATGVGILCLYLLDASGHEQVLSAATQSLADHATDDQTPYPCYTLYYTTQAAFQAGDAVWATVSKVTAGRLLALQEQEGGWPPSKSDKEPGRTYATSMALLTLTVPYRLLPIYQR